MNCATFTQVTRTGLVINIIIMDALTASTLRLFYLVENDLETFPRTIA